LVNINGHSSNILCSQFDDLWVNISINIFKMIGAIYYGFCKY
jgi:hypothetical protein